LTTIAQRKEKRIFVSIEEGCREAAGGCPAALRLISEKQEGGGALAPGGHPSLSEKKEGCS